jgi:hypothetical protein
MGRKLLMVINAGEFVDSESLHEDAEYSLVLRVTRSSALAADRAGRGRGLDHARRWRELAVLYAIPLSLLASIALFFVFSGTATR